MRFGGGTPILYGAAATVGLQVVRVAVKAKREYQPRVSPRRPFPRLIDRSVSKHELRDVLGGVYN